jgi:hypothetical protein
MASSAKKLGKTRANKVGERKKSIAVGRVVEAD